MSALNLRMLAARRVRLSGSSHLRRGLVSAAPSPSAPSSAPGLSGVGATVRKAPAGPRVRKAVLTLTPAAVARLRGLTDGPNPQLLRVGTKKKGCSGQTYSLDYVSAPAKFDEVVEQDGVKVVVDSKALFSLIGSEMDYVEEKLKSEFVFRNPNVKE
ncbi:Iron-sulfur assembly protein 1, partial [Borealophlyctis nickersoniae]